MNEYREIANNLQFQEINEFNNVIDYQDEPDTFYMILNGIVSCKVRNMNILKWEIQWKDYQKLLKWKTDEFDPKVQKAKENN